MPLSVLIPYEVTNRCYLSEALYWVALHRFPIASLLETGDDQREYDDFIEGITAPYSLEPVTGDESFLAGIPVNPLWEAEQSFTHYIYPELLERFLANEKDEQRREDFKLSLAESIAFYQRQAAWDATFESFLDLHSAGLFVALRQGRVIAIGKPLPKKALVQLLKRTEASERALKRRELGYYESKPANEPRSRGVGVNLDRVDWEPIPKEFWVSKGINWRRNCAEGSSASYALILIETVKLFEVFPVPKSEIVRQVSQVGNGYVILDGGDQAINPRSSLRGRPSFDWKDFDIEMAKRVRDRTLPPKQEALILEMQAWCQAHWGRDVGRSTLLQKIKPYYDAFVRPSES